MAKIKDIMTTSILSMPKEKGLQEAIKIMADSKVSSMIITDNDRPVGILTERDLIRKILLPGKSVKKLRIDDVMTKNLQSISPDTELHEASEMMKEKGIRHIPVIDNGRLVGIVTQTDIVSETRDIHKTNIKFMTYQNIQTAIIILFFIFLIAFLIWRKFYN